MSNTDMKEIVINDDYGGFSLSPQGLKLYCDLKGQPCYFYKTEYKGLEAELVPTSPEKLNSLFFSAYNVPNAHEIIKHYSADMSPAERKERSALFEKMYISNRDIARDCPVLVTVVKTLGYKASGAGASLKVVEVPSGVSWEIEEHDGNEWVAEEHRTWS